MPDVTPQTPGIMLGDNRAYLTRLSPLIATNLPRTQTAYQRHLSVESNIMWATQVIGHVLALGRSAVLPLIDASGAFDSLSHRYIDDMMKRQKVDDKGRSIFRAVVTAVRGLRRTRLAGFGGLVTGD